MVANGPLQACRSMESPAKLVAVRHRGEVANAPCGRQARHVQAVARTDETVGAADTKELWTIRACDTALGDRVILATWPYYHAPCNFARFAAERCVKVEFGAF